MPPPHTSQTQTGCSYYHNCPTHITTIHTCTTHNSSLHNLPTTPMWQLPEMKCLNLAEKVYHMRFHHGSQQSPYYPFSEGIKWKRKKQYPRIHLSNGINWSLGLSLSPFPCLSHSIASPSQKHSLLCGYM